MKILATILFSCLFATIVDSLDADGLKLEIKEPLLHKIPISDKETVRIDKNIKKEFELKTKLGTVLKLSKTITYNDGGQSTILSKLHAKSKKLPSRPLEHRNPGDDYVIAAIYNKSAFTSGAAAPHHVPEKQPLGKHTKALLVNYKKAIKLKKILFIKKLSEIVRAITRDKKIGAPCCPTGPCCPGKQG